MSDAKETTSDSEEIECPHCGETITDLWDYSWNNRECIDVECGHCDGNIVLTRIVSVDYRAKAVTS